MTTPTVPQSTIDRLFQLPDPVKTLGRAAWLYLALLNAASDQGVVLRTQSRLSKTLDISEDEINEWLRRLVDAQLVRVSTPGKFLVIRFDSWPAESSEDPTASGALAEQGSSSPRDVPVNGHSSAQALALQDNSAGEGGQGEGDSLRHDVRSLLPEADAEEIDRVLTMYPEPVLRKAIGRVAKTPPTKIRKSKTALFRFLLARFSEEIDGNDV